MNEKIFTVLLLLITIFFLFSPVASLVFQNEPDGFRGISWGTEVSSLTGMVYDSQHTWAAGTTYFFIRKGDTLIMGGAKLLSIRYGFWEGKLSDVLIEVKGRKNWLALKAACFERFGQGFKANFYQENYRWSGKTTSIVLEYKEKGNLGTILMKSESMYNQIRSLLKEKARGEKPWSESPSFPPQPNP